jgi:hypothetical protein
MSSTTIRTHYRAYPGSNVGQVVALANGRQRSTRWDQAQTSDTNHLMAAVRLAERLGVRVVAEVYSNDSGTRRRFSVID